MKGSGFREREGEVEESGGRLRDLWKSGYEKISNETLLMLSATIVPRQRL